MIFSQVFIAIQSMSPNYCAVPYGSGWPASCSEGHSLHSQLMIAPSQRYTAYCEDPYCSDIYPAINQELASRGFQYEQGGANIVVNFQGAQETTHKIQDQAFVNINKEAYIHSQFASDKISIRFFQSIFEIMKPVFLMNQAILSIGSGYSIDSQTSFNILASPSLEMQAGLEKMHDILSQGTFLISKPISIAFQSSFSISKDLPFSFQANFLMDGGKYFSNQSSFNILKGFSIFNSVTITIPTIKEILNQIFIYIEKVGNFHNQAYIAVTKNKPLSSQFFEVITKEKNIDYQGNFSILTPQLLGYCLEAYCENPYCNYIDGQKPFYFNNQVIIDVKNLYNVLAQANLYAYKEVSIQALFEMKTVSFFNNQASFYRYENKAFQGLFSISKEKLIENQILISILEVSSIQSQAIIKISSEGGFDSQVDFKIEKINALSFQASLYRYEERKSQGDFSISKIKWLSFQADSNRIEKINSQADFSIGFQKDILFQATFSRSELKEFYSQGTFEIATPFFFGYCLSSYCEKSYCSYEEPQNGKVLNLQANFTIPSSHNYASQASLYRYEERAFQADIEADAKHEIDFQASLYRYEEKAFQGEVAILKDHDVPSQGDIAILGEEELPTQAIVNISSINGFHNQGEIAILSIHNLNNQVNLYRYEERKSQADFTIATSRVLQNQFISDLLKFYSFQGDFTIWYERDFKAQSSFAIKKSIEKPFSGIFTISNMYFIGYCSNDYCQENYCSDNYLMGGFKGNWQADFSILKPHPISFQVNLYRYEERLSQAIFTVKSDSIYHFQAIPYRYEFRRHQYEPSILAFKGIGSQYGLEMIHDLSFQMKTAILEEAYIPSQMYFSSPYIVFGDKGGYCSSQWPSKLWAYTSTIAWRVLTQASLKISRTQPINHQVSIIISNPHYLATQYVLLTPGLKELGMQAYIFKGIIRRNVRVIDFSAAFINPKFTQFQFKRRPF